MDKQEKEAGARIAFINARVMLKRLEALDVQNPYVELFSDGSGQVHLGSAEAMEESGVKTQQVYEIIMSHRIAWDSTPKHVIVQFCETLKDPNYGEGG